MLQQKGIIVADLGPAEGNPRNSEGAFLELKDGKLLFAYSRFIGDSNADFSLSCIAAKYSSDEGATWSDDEIIIVPEEHQAINIMSVSLLRMTNGDIGLFYLVRHSRLEMRLYIRRSGDEGVTWGEPRCCMPETGYYVVNHDRIVRLSNGRIVIPASWHKFLGSPGMVTFFLSEDDGETWRETKQCMVLHSPHTKTGLQEPGVIELSSGTLWAWARTDLGRQYEMFSGDGGETWTQAAPSLFTSPASPLSMKRMPRKEQLLAVWNPVPNYMTRVFEKFTYGRTLLIGAISEDEGRTWSRFFAVEREEDNGGYCYTAIHFTRDDHVLLAYCAGTADDKSCLARLKIRKIPLSDIYSS